jgi:hypothetical protein
MRYKKLQGINLENICTSNGIRLSVFVLIEMLSYTNLNTNEKKNKIGNQIICEISSSHGGEYDVQSCLLGCTAV